MTSQTPPPGAPLVTPPAAVPRRSWWLSLEGFLERMFILFSLYVLSIGPLYWQWVDAKYASGSTWLAAFYEPLYLLGELWPLFGKCVNWYLTFWVG